MLLQVGRVDSRTIAREIMRHMASFTASHAHVLEAIAVFDEHNCAAEFGCRSTGAWLTRFGKMKKTRAYEYAALAPRIVKFQHLMNTFKDGLIDYTSVRFMAEYLTEENEYELVRIAIEQGYSGLEMALAGGEPTRGQQRREHYFHLRDDGAVTRGWFAMNAVEGAQLKAALKVGALAYYSLFSSPEDYVGADGEFDHDALDRALEQAKSQDVRMLRSGYGLPPARMLLQSLMGMVQLVRAGMVKSTKLAPAAHVNVQMTTDGRAFLQNNMAAPAHMLANIVGNGELRGVLFDEKGLVLNYGRRRRVASPAQVDALFAMWGQRCAMPGCNHDKFMEMHHIDAWADGGATDLENLIPLCSACHALVTEGAVQVLKGQGEVHFVFPGGERWVARYGKAPVRNDRIRTQGELVRCEASFADEHEATPGVLDQVDDPADDGDEDKRDGAVDQGDCGGVGKCEACGDERASQDCFHRANAAWGDLCCAGELGHDERQGDADGGVAGNRPRCEVEHGEVE